MKRNKKTKKISRIDPEVIKTLITVTLWNIAYIITSITFSIYSYYKVTKISIFIFVPMLNVGLCVLIYASVLAVIEEQEYVDKKRNSDT